MQLKMMPYSLYHSSQSLKAKSKPEAQMFESDFNHAFELQQVYLKIAYILPNFLWVKIDINILMQVLST